MSNKSNLDLDALYDYICSVSVREPLILQALRKETEKDPMSRMQIAPEQGQFMALLLKLMGARRVIEVGTFTGYSALAMALALPADGQIICCDISEKWTSIAREYWQRAHMEQKIDLQLAPAVTTLQSLVNDGLTEHFDFAFIDADKEQYNNYYELCLKLIRPNGLIVIDNTLWSGNVIDPSAQDVDTNAIRALNLKLKDDARVDLSLLPVADGLTLLRKR
jgi:predicted O-methyltransferase YrrM